MGKGSSAPVGAASTVKEQGKTSRPSSQAITGYALDGLDHGGLLFVPS